MRKSAVKKPLHAASLRLNSQRAEARGSSLLARANPLLGLSIAQAQNIYDAARNGGGLPLLQRIYDEIERTDPILLTCVERRAAALSGMGWSVRPVAAAREAAAEAQKDAAERFLAEIENFDEFVEHLSSAFFRGFAFAQPRWKGSQIERIELLPSWAFSRDETGAWFFNPTGSSLPDEWESLDGTGIVSIIRSRAIDYPALLIFLRHSLAERDWGRFVERYGIPPVDVVMSEAATEENRADYLSAAEAARDGRSAVWPSGSQVSRADSTRATDPFLDFLRHQEELTVLMATGGKLTSLAEAGSGTLAGNAQMDVWKEIVAHDARIIGSTINRQLLRPWLDMTFPGQHPAVYFDLGTDAQPSPTELLDLAMKAQSAGYRMAQADLEEGTGYEFEIDEAAPAFGGMGVAGAASGGSGVTVLRNDEHGEIPDEAQYADTSALAEALSEDLTPVRDRIEAILSEPDEARAREMANELTTDIPHLLRGRTALSEALEREIALAYAGAFREESQIASSVENTYKNPAIARIVDGFRLKFVQKGSRQRDDESKKKNDDDP